MQELKNKFDKKGYNIIIVIYKINNPLLILNINEINII